MILGSSVALWLGTSWLGAREDLRDADSHRRHLEGVIERQSDALREAEERAAESRREVDALKRKSRVLEMYGAEFDLYRTYDLRRERGSALAIGKCGGAPCFLIQILDVIESAEFPMVKLRFAGAGFTLYSFPPTTPILSNTMPLRVGCRSLIHAKDQDFTVAIEDDRVSSLRLGVVVRAGTLTEGGVQIETSCPE